MGDDPEFMLKLRLLLLLTASWLQAAEADPFRHLEYRCIGPAVMGGRATDVEGVAGDPSIVYAGFGAAGLWKSVNGGHSWTPILEKQTTYSVGDFALEPGNPDVIWLGSGESNTRNSVSFGDGVYRSTDGGKTWQHLGLRETERISRVLIHPTNPHTVLVGALGHSFGPHPDRGVFLTTDNGRTWQKTLHLDDHHGVSDMDMHPTNPNIVYAAMWRFERKPWTHTSGSEEGGVFRSADGGKTWTKLSKGLPKLLGRIGVKVAPSNPRVVYVIAESKEGTLYRSEDGGDTFREITRNREIVSRGFYYADMRVDPVNENKIYAVASNLLVSIDGGKTWKSIVGGTHIDYHALWIDPKDPRRMWNGNDGGLAVSHDGGTTWQAVYNIALGQFYQVHADNRRPFYYVMGGLQDNGSWTGPSRTREPAGILNEDWRMVQFGDGFHMMNHPENPDLYLSESQGGMVGRTNMLTREQQMITPQPIGASGGPASEARYRFNWNAPLIPSAHDSNTVYLGGNVLFRSQDFGAAWTAISPDLTTNDPEKQKPAGGPIWFDNSTAEYHSTIISIGESPMRRGDLWVGTDDGRLHRSPDGGRTWTELTGNVTGLPAHSPVSHVEPSRISADTAYAAFDRHMFDDFRPHIFKTTDGGKTWMRIVAGIPEKAYVHVVREDPKNASLLYAGTELGLYASWDSGATWSSLALKNLPPVPVHDIKIHPRENDLILGTHGRSVVILDDAAAIQQMNKEVAAKPFHLFPPRTALRFTTRFTRYGIGGAVFKGTNPAYGALLTYFLKEKVEEKTPLKLEILDASGKVIRELAKLNQEAGVHRVAWDLKSEAPAVRKPPSEFEEETGRGPRGYEVLPGTYRVRLTVGDKTVETSVEVQLDPDVQVSSDTLRRRFERGQRLWEMVDKGNAALKRLDSLVAQLESTAKLAKDNMGDAGKDAIKLTEAYKKETAALADSIGRPVDAQRLEVGARLIEKIAGLFSAVEGVNAAPTQAMEEAFTELSPQYEQRMQAVARLFAETVPTWNQALQKAGAPVLVIPR